MRRARLAGKSFGSTKSGIAPFYSDKYAKIGFQVMNYSGNEDELKEKIANVCTLKKMLCLSISIISRSSIRMRYLIL